MATSSSSSKSSSPTPSSSSSSKSSSSSTPKDPVDLNLGGTSALFDLFSPSSSSNANNYNTNNSASTQAATADANNASYWAGQQTSDLAKDAASYMTSLGSQQREAKTAAEQQLQSSQQSAQQSAQESARQQQTVGVGSNKGYTQSQVFGPSNTATPAPPNQLWLAAQAQQQKAYDQAMNERNANIAMQNSVHQNAQQTALQQAVIAQQGAQQKELAQLQTQSAENIAKTNAAAQVQSSLFGSLGGMFSSMGGSAGRHSYW